MLNLAPWLILLAGFMWAWAKVIGGHKSDTIPKKNETRPAPVFPGVGRILFAYGSKYSVEEVLRTPSVTVVSRWARYNMPSAR